MKKMLLQKKITISLLVLILSSFLYAENAKVKELVKAQYYSRLVEKGNISTTKDDGSLDLPLLPQNVYADKIKASMIEKDDKNFPFTYEGLYLLNKQNLLKNSNSSKSAITIEDVSRITRSISKMEGMKYYSSTKKKETVLYKKTYMVDKENGKNQIPDQNTGNADGQISYCMQDDSSFGVNHYKLMYFQNEDTLMAQFNITDNMGIGPFVAIKPGKMVINILVIDCGEDLLLYLNTDVDSVKYPGIKAQITDSMTSRMDAVYKWFLTQF